MAGKEREGEKRVRRITNQLARVEQVAGRRDPYLRRRGKNGRVLGYGIWTPPKVIPGVQSSRDQNRGGRPGAQQGRGLGGVKKNKPL